MFIWLTEHCVHENSTDHCLIFIWPTMHYQHEKHGHRNTETQSAAYRCHPHSWSINKASAAYRLHPHSWLRPLMYIIRMWPLLRSSLVTIESHRLRKILLLVCTRQPLKDIVLNNICRRTSSWTASAAEASRHWTTSCPKHPHREVGHRLEPHLPRGQRFGRLLAQASAKRFGQLLAQASQWVCA